MCQQIEVLEMKRTLDIRLLVESDLPDHELYKIATTAAHALTRRCQGRLVVAVGTISPEAADDLWKAASLDKHPAPTATFVPIQGTARGKT